MKEAKPAGRVFTFADSDAVSVCALQRNYHLDRFRQHRFFGFLICPDRNLNFLYFLRVLPILFASSMIILQLLTRSRSRSAAAKDDGDRYAALYALHFGGARRRDWLLYWLVGNIVGFIQQFLIIILTKKKRRRRMKRLGKKPLRN